MAILAKFADLALLHEFQSLDAGDVRRMASDAARRARVQGVPLRQIKMIMIQTGFARAGRTFVNLNMALDARFIAERIHRDRGLAVRPAHETHQILRALLQSVRAPERSGAAMTINAMRRLVRVVRRQVGRAGLGRAANVRCLRFGVAGRAKWIVIL